jgi:hypothetical protein
MGVLKKWRDALRILNILERLFLLPSFVGIVGPRSIERGFLYRLYFNNGSLFISVLAFVLAILTNINGFYKRLDFL